jgi:hypothetical protein
MFAGIRRSDDSPDMAAPSLRLDIPPLLGAALVGKRLNTATEHVSAARRVADVL